MRSLLFVFAVAAFFSATVFSVEVAAAADPIGPVLTASISRHSIGPGSLDFKKQSILKRIPKQTKLKSVPNLDPLIDQLIRHAELNSSATKILPWVYTTSTESVVADFEEALTRLDFADDCLQEAMLNTLGEYGSLEMDHSLQQAAIQLDYAEITIMLLVEIAKLEL